ncbi:hypothetical protein AQ490_22100 [Wenjunlia vitaminophila]|uniref:DUF3893 domain-containing protein n=1 Tax=Wenjunlia vitaminophila TaxID=76728 RepID=A0A0T6LSX2_WENVI|nr:DUF3962 domain-containing protein [Wenjunlia vitaminophila]KRV49009.1 hypothetical protein AQ490_22100 [Wenjunlia vitaminophila]
MPTYGSIRRAAYVLDSDAPPWTVNYFAMAYPEHWDADLLELCNLGRGGKEPLRSVPTRRLDGVLQTLAPDLVVRPRSRPKIGEETAPEQDFWLYVPDNVPHPLPERTMRQLIDAWLRTLAPRSAHDEPGYRSLLLRTSEQLAASTPEWQVVEGVDLLQAPPTPGETAAPTARQFQLATDALARRIMALEPYEFDGGSLLFRAVPRGPREQGAELMSQPLRRTIKRREWWFSVVLNISLHTVPFDGRPRLHLHWGVRRWATHPRSDTGRLNLPYDRATSVYLRPTIPWLVGAPHSDRYALARLVRDRARDGFEWLHNDPAGILHHLNLRGRFPCPDELLQDPQAWIGDGPGVGAAVVHSNHMGTHEVGIGFMPHQRSQLTAWAEKALPEGVVRVPDLVRRGSGKAPPVNKRSKPRDDEAKVTEVSRASQARRSALAVMTRVTRGAAVPDGELPVVEVRLLWQTASVRRAAIAAFAEILGLDGSGFPEGANICDRSFDDARPGTPVILQWHTPEVVLRLRCIPLIEGIGDRLRLDPTVRGRGRRLAEAVTTRRQETRSYLKADGAEPSLPSLALVEIAHSAMFRPSDTDPKFALRLGCADAGALTQFVATPSTDRRINNENSLDHRVLNAWQDGLRQLGVRTLPQHTLRGELPDGLQYAALWMVKRRKDGPTRLPKHLPVAVLVTPIPGVEGLAAVRGWDDDAREWVPYPTFLLRLVKQAEISPDAYTEFANENGLSEPANGQAAPTTRITSRQWRANLAEQRRQTANFLQRVLHSLHGQPTALITHAQNSRHHWPWLQDGAVVRDLLRLGHAPASRLNDELRLIRVRGIAGRETPQWWGIGDPGKPNGQPAGFWALPAEEADSRPAFKRVFYSTTSRPGTQPISPSLDRLAVRVTASGKLTSQVGTNAWNPALVEIAVLGCHPDGGQGINGDSPEAFAMAMHQLRQAPDYADDLSLPLPLHLAGLAQAYVLPMFSDDEKVPEDKQPTIPSETSDASASDLDPDLTEVASPAEGHEPGSLEQLSLFE